MDETPNAAVLGVPLPPPAPILSQPEHEFTSDPLFSENSQRATLYIAGIGQTTDGALMSGIGP